MSIGLSSAILVASMATIPAVAQSSTTVIYNFRGFPNGEFPHGALAVDASGAFYGTTQGGGAACHISSGFGCGAIFKLTPSGSGLTERILYSFHGNTAKDGEEPLGGLILDRTGTVYGTTEYGGGTTGCSNGCGTVFKLAPGTKRYRETILYRFQGGTTDGGSPREALLADSKGDLFGTTAQRGKAGFGTVFELTPNGSRYAETIIHNFTLSHIDCACGGAFPTGSLIEDATGALYGTTTEGGNGDHCKPNGCGTIFKLTPQGSGYAETVLRDFMGSSRLDGSDPRGALIVDASGALYGTTSAGGRNLCGGVESTAGCGTVFKLTPVGSRYKEEILYRFKGNENGSSPWTGLLAVPGGTLYGTTNQGGQVCYGGSSPSSPPSDCGTLFSLTPRGSGYVQSVLHRFAGASVGDGAYPGATLIETGGALYGTTITGGTGHRVYACWTNPTGYPFGCGAVYRVTP
jgi:uncharacterized repeat protein (TIGR03803 family)